MKKLVVILMTALLLCGCKKEEGPVIDPNMAQPVLGEDAEGYGGFTYLQAYSFGEEGGNSVLYLPKDENAYVGNTTMICKTEGVEVTVNYNPMVSDEVADKSARDKLKYILDSEYSEIYTDSFVNFERNDIVKSDENTVVCSLSYLVYDETQKGYVANWLEQYYATLEDGREFRITIKVDSLVETPQSGVVVEELERYLNVEFLYETGALQAKISDHEPDETDQIKMSGVQQSFGIYSFYLPQEWEENEIAKLLFWTQEDIKDGTIVAEAYSKDAYEKDPEAAILMGKVDAGGLGIDAGQFGTLSEGEIQVIIQNMVGNPEYMDGKVTYIKSLNYTDVGFVLRIDFEGYSGCDGRIYELCYGNEVYDFIVVVKEEADNKEAYIQILDEAYQTLEVK